jgi:tol-pal system protein YbgF
MSKKHLIISCIAVTLAFGALSLPARADLFGESDEEKAQRAQHEQNQDTQIQQLSQQVRDLQETLRQQTGQNEVLSHRIQELNDKIDHQQKDFEYRLCTLAAQQLGTAAAPDPSGNTLPCPAGIGAPAAGAVVAPVPTAQAQPAPHLAPGPGVLGTLPANAPLPLAPVAASDNHAPYDAAMNLLAKAQYDEARAAFRSFADTYPKDELAPMAVYWVGDIAYVQKDYPSAARAFVEEIKKYPTSSRGPDSMLKLGQSLLAMGQKKEGCTTLGAIASRYPTASKTVTGQAAAERKAACGK